MKFTKNLFALLLTAVLVFTMSIPAFAAVATDVVTAEAGETVSLTYTYTDVAGIYGAFTLSNPDMVSSFKITIPDLGLEEVEYNEADGRFSYFLSDNMTFDIVLEVVVSSTAKAGDKCEVTFKHEAVSEDGVLPEEENFTVDTITIVIEDAPVVELDYSKLEALIDEANALVEDEYTEESWKAMADVLADATALVGNAQTQQEIDDMAAALQAAIDALVKKTPVVELDYSKLEALIDEANALVEDEYTEESWKAMSEVLAGAEALIGNAQTQKEIDDMVAALQAAIDALVKKTPVVELDYSKLEALIDEANALVEDEYTEESWKAMSEVLAGAEALIGNAQTQKEIDDMVAALQAAIDALVKKTPVVELDYSKLEALIASIDELNKENYTEESWAAMEAVLAEARELLKNKNAQSQDEIDAKVKSLQAAVDALVGKYGDNSTIIYALVAMIIAAVATVAVLKTRKKARN